MLATLSTARSLRLSTLALAAGLSLACSGPARPDLDGSADAHDAFAPDADARAPDDCDDSPDAGDADGDAHTPDAEPPDGGPSCSTSWPGDVRLATGLADEVTALVADRAGNLYAGGYERGQLGARNEEPAGDAVGVVLRLDPSGAVTLRREVDGPRADSVDALAWDEPSGSLYYAGRFEDAPAPGTTAAQFDVRVGRLDAHDALIPLARWGNERPQQPRRIAVDAGGGVVVAGYDLLYTPTNYVESWEDAFVVSFGPSSDGLAPRWAYQANSAGTDFAFGLALAGGEAPTVLFAGNDAGGARAGAWVSALRASDGAPQWHKRYSNVGFDAVAAVVRAPDGDVILAGSTMLTLGARAYGEQDAFVASIDPATGEPRWIAQAGSAESEWVTDLALGADGTIYVAGETLGSLERGVPSAGDFDAFVLAFDARGAIAGAWQRGTAGDDHASSVAVDACGRVFVGGYTTGEIVPGVPNAGARDGFVLRAEPGAFADAP